MSSPKPDEVVARYVDHLRLRAIAMLAIRALCVSIGIAALLFVLLGALAGPVTTPTFARSAFSLVALLGVGLLGVVLWPALGLRGSGGCSLLAKHDAALASRVRSVLELQAGAQASPELVSAHAKAVCDALAVLPAARVLPTRGLVHPSIAGGLGAICVSGLLLVSNDAARNGFDALLSPAQERTDGVRVGRVVASTRARFIYPSYLSMAPSESLDSSTLRAPRGTTVELTVVPHLQARRGTLAIGEAQIGMSAAPNGRLFARFVMQQDSELKVRIESDGQWYEDNTARRVLAIPDRPPQVTLDAAQASGSVQAQQSLALHLHASDDHGLSTLELVARGQDGKEQRRRLWSALSSDNAKATVDLHDQLEITPAELGAQPGDILQLWIEAKDGDIVAGPNVGTSKPINLEIATDAEEVALPLPMLRDVLNGALDALADRLETPVPDVFVAAEQRLRELHDVNQPWLDALVQLISASRKGDAQRSLELGQLQAVLNRTRQELQREKLAYQGTTRAERAWSDADARVVAQHERDVLTLADMLAQGLIDEARAHSEELGKIKEHLSELLQKLKSSNSPETQREVLAEIAKAQRRLQELAKSLSKLSQHVPSEFVNREALPKNAASSALDDLRAAVEAGDMDAAERQLEALGQEIAALQENIQQGGARFREAHYGAQDSALAAARSELSMLSAEQDRLADRSRDLVKRAAQRASDKSSNASVSEEMLRQAEGIERAMEDLASNPYGPESASLERARTRMRDAADAMRNGDVAEARKMAGSATGNLGQAASSLNQDAQMYPGPHGETAARAEAANAALSKLDQLQRQLQRATPKLDEYVAENERRQLQGDAVPQRAARDKAQQLSDKLGQGPGGDGPPLAPSAGQDLRESAEAMRRAEQALDRGNPQEASHAQEDASRRLRDVEESLAQNSRPGKKTSPGSGEREGEGSGEGMQSNAKVRIPGADEFSGPAQLRRRLLDAMREPAPDEFKSAVERYYRELLQ